jgi:DNA-binding MarR family transcriptional regulator
MSQSPKHVLSPDLLEVSAAIMSCGFAIGNALDQNVVQATGLDRTIFDLLVRLDQAPNNQLRAVTLSRQLFLSPSYISRRIDRSEEAGLVERLPDPADRRAMLVALTEGGRDVLRAAAEGFEAVLNTSIHDHLTADDATALIGLLKRIEGAARS